MGTHSLRFLRDFLACVAGGFGGRESRAKTSGAAAGEMRREPRQSRRSRVNERLRREEPSPHFATRFGPRARLAGDRQLRRPRFFRKSSFFLGRSSFFRIEMV